MDLFEQLNEIETLIEQEEEKKKQEALFCHVPGNVMDFLVEDLAWEEIALEKAQQAEKLKLKPLTAGFGPWAW